MPLPQKYHRDTLCSKHSSSSLYEPGRSAAHMPTVVECLTSMAKSRIGMESIRDCTVAKKVAASSLDLVRIVVKQLVSTQDPERDAAINRGVAKVLDGNPQGWNGLCDVEKILVLLDCVRRRYAQEINEEVEILNIECLSKILAKGICECFALLNKLWLPWCKWLGPQR